MSLADRLGELEPTRRGGVCGVARILSELGPKDRDALVAALSVPVGDPERISNQRIADVLVSEGYRIHPKTVETHRKGGCACEPVG